MRSPPSQGVWIEMILWDGIRGYILRHPLLRGCGLKYYLDWVCEDFLCHPLLRGCGLKYQIEYCKWNEHSHPLLRGCGLKSAMLDNTAHTPVVTPFSWGVD